MRLVNCFIFLCEECELLTSVTHHYIIFEMKTALHTDNLLLVCMYFIKPVLCTPACGNGKTQLATAEIGAAQATLNTKTERHTGQQGQKK